MLFLLFLVIAAIFWLIVSLDEQVAKTYEVPLIVEDIPSDISLERELPSEIRVTVIDKGTRHLQFMIFGAPEMRVRFDEVAADGKVRLSNSKITSSLHTLFSSSSTFTSMNPDSVLIRYTRNTSSSE